MKVVPHQSVGDTDWNHVCEHSEAAWLFHRHEWIDIESRFHGHRSLSFAIEGAAGLVGIQPLYVSDVGIGWNEKLIHSGIHRHTGFATLDSVTADVRHEASRLAMDTIVTIARDHDADRIQLNSQNLAPANLGAARDEMPVWVREYGFDLGLNFGANGMLPVPGMATCCADQVVMLDADDDQLFARLSEACRRAVRKAERAAVAFADAGHGLDTYWRLATLAAERTGERLPSRDYFSTIERELVPRGLAKFLFATLNGEPVAAVLLALNKKAASYLGGVSDPQHLPLRVNDFVHWSAMRWARRSGYRYYRLGPAFPTVPRDWPIARVSRFKERFGGRSLTTIQGSLFRKPERYRAGGIDHLTALCAAPAVVDPDAVADQA